MPITEDSLPTPSGVISADETMVLPQEAPSFAWLVDLADNRRGRLLRLKATGSTLGRAAENDIVVEHEMTSRFHARLYAEEGVAELQFYVQDLASANGTFVNGERVARQLLSDNDCIRVGASTFVFKQL